VVAGSEIARLRGGGTGSRILLLVGLTLQILLVGLTNNQCLPPSHQELCVIVGGALFMFVDYLQMLNAGGFFVTDYFKAPC
jgi:hypothetical protein